MSTKVEMDGWTYGLIIMCILMIVGVIFGVMSLKGIIQHTPPDVNPAPEGITFAGGPEYPEITGKVVYESTCKACHGENGEGGTQTGNGPNLTILDEEYFRKHYTMIMEGKRSRTDNAEGKIDGAKNMKDTLEKAIIPADYTPEKDKKFTAEHYELAIKYVLSLPEASSKHATEADTAAYGGDAAAGKLKYAICATCHGPNGEGGKFNPTAPAPRIAGQADWYVIHQVKNFKENVRGNDPSDVPAMQMKAMSMTLATDKDIKDVAAYIKTLSGKK